ncbi:DHHC zinc finger domain protein [Dictyocaulus viviparus]|uniref:Palmitoyltransferase n=1 Tax=Dictyocaulus viviparus TaxID=29172 RepID=A0A0D8XLZ2_DICVI|nr:DHHC zinc finger domain protein [Dictyocaulus viviparus]
MCFRFRSIAVSIDNKVDAVLATYGDFINKCINVLGSVLVYVVYIITIFLTFTSFAIIIPYEQVYKSPLLLGLLVFVGIYFLVNILFHYGKARTLKPIGNLNNRQGDRWCERCKLFRNERTHHCSVCRRCILGMDHHCIWINQCVGSHNHRHFFLFISYLTGATFTIVLCGFNTLYDHMYVGISPSNFCSSQLAMAPLQSLICKRGDFARNAVIFCYFISCLLFVLVGLLTIWNCFLISCGFTYIEYIKQFDDPSKKSSMRINLNKGFLNNWKSFLGLRRNRTVLRHILLPCSHPPIVHDSDLKLENEHFDIV